MTLVSRGNLVAMTPCFWRKRSYTFSFDDPIAPTLSLYKYERYSTHLPLSFVRLAQFPARALRCPVTRTSFTVVYFPMPTTGERFERAVSIMARLRGPGGCPWDREQTFDSIKPYTLEEAYEVLEAIDNRDWDELTGELGDLLLQVLFYAQMAKDLGTFSIDEVLDRLSNKLVDRHPHVFGDVKAETSSEVLRNWEALKAEEKNKRRNADAGKTAGTEKDGGAAESVLAGISSAMPALLEAHKLSSRAARVGFDWPNVDGLFEKLHEETEELREQLRDFPAPGPRPGGS